MGNEAHSTPAEQPAFRQIADKLRDGIDDGTYASGSRLPSEADLVREFDVAKETVRAAIRQLRKEGRVETRKGAGAFVRPSWTIVRNETARVSASQWGTGKSVWEPDLNGRALDVDSSTVVREQAPERIERVLGTGQVWSRSRRYLVDGRPVMISTSFIPAEIADGTRITEPDTGAGGVYARLRDAGHGPVKFRQQVRARVPSLSEARALGIGDDTPVLATVRTAFDDAERAVEINEMVLDSSVYVLLFDYDA